MSRPADIAKQQIDRLVREGCAAAAGRGLLPPDLKLRGKTEMPRASVFGDFACSHALAAARKITCRRR